VTRYLAALVIAALAAAGLACAQAAAEPLFQPLAHSALISVEAAAPAPDTLTLRIRHTADQTPVTPEQLAVTTQGRSLPATPNPDGTWSVALKNLGGKPPGKLDLTIGHEGIRELLSGTMAPPAAGTAAAAASGLVRDHKQLAWWILNIAIVLIAAIAISRRMS
jgi:hypothetical protein